MTVTLKEAIRKKTFLVMGIITVLYLIFWVAILNYFQNAHLSSRSVDFKPLASIMLTQTVLQFSSMIMCLLTIVLGAGAVSSELETGMIHAMLSRPLGRAEYILGKFFGLAILISAYATGLMAAILIIGRAYSLDTIIALSFPQIVQSWLIYICVPLAVLCVTLYGSISLKTVPNGLLMIFVYILGNIGGIVEMIGNYINSKVINSVGILISLISPFHTLYASAERVLLPSSGIAGELVRGAGGLTGSGQPASVVMYLYIAFYAIGFLLISIRKFRKLDIT
ncbi:ABC transporter permease [Ethanoligenens harbinense]|nr:ABC transporter permease [Ethanoligenens harbinense YUAN-3]AYF39992.1 ABC transporter permease [Ethanoligenens harbinense]AYF42822.1 ABC transporter permease [Ethanoligenens harbinense]QCN93576.1 ABC transporter permease [Ethanoligenens harbinense]